MPRQALHLPAEPGVRFALHHSPAGRPRAALMLLPAFAEEMNKLRRPLAHAATTFAEQGFAVLSLDLLGCGDSSGNFEDANWEAWQADVALGQAWLRQTYPEIPLIAWGVRAGCLLGGASGWDGQLWWQPSQQGKTVLQQFLRIRLAAEMGNSERSTAAELKAQLAAGETVWIGGYGLRQALADGLETASLAPPQAPCLWLEVQAQAEPSLLPASQNTLNKWQAPNLQARAVAGPQAWAATELEDCEALTAASLDWLRTQWPVAA